jgi:hypothetical protein
MKHIVELSSEEYGVELFRYDSRREAVAGIARLAADCARQQDGVARRIALVIGETPYTDEVEAKLNAFLCPKCGSDDICELTLCVIIHRVGRWNQDGTPEEYEGSEVDWESDMPYDMLDGPQRTEHRPTFECTNCTAQFHIPNEPSAS